MESLESTLQGKLKAVTFTLSKTDSILEKRDKVTIQRHKDSLNSVLNAIQTLKQQIEEAKFTNGESEEDVGDWGKSVEARIEQVEFIEGDSRFRDKRESETTRRAMQVNKYYTTRLLPFYFFKKFEV